MKLALVAKSAWKDLAPRVDALAASLSKALLVPVEITVVLKDYGKIPADKDGRITAGFIDETLALSGFDGACLLVSLADREKYRLKASLRGHYHRDEDGYAEFWVASDRLTKRKGKPQFEETFTHELCHALYHQLGIPDRTHEFHNTDGDVWLAVKDIAAHWPKPKEVVSSPKNVLDGLTREAARGAKRLAMAMAELGKPIRITEGFRSMERQAALYAQGRTTPGAIVTNAKPGESLHNSGRAFDVVFAKTGYDAPDADWALAAMLGRSFGLKPGYYWKGFQDKPHFEA